MAAGHVGGVSSLVGEGEPLGVKMELPLESGPVLLQNVWPILLDIMRGRLRLDLSKDDVACLSNKAEDEFSFAPGSVRRCYPRRAASKQLGHTGAQADAAEPRSQGLPRHDAPLPSNSERRLSLNEAGPKRR